MLIISLMDILDPFIELNIDLDPMRGLWLLISLPALLVLFITLVDRKPAHLESAGPPDRWSADIHIVIAFEIGHDLPGPKMKDLPQVDGSCRKFGIRFPWAMKRATGTI